VVVCLVAFTPEGYLSLPGRVWSLRWFKAILDYPEFLRAFRDSLWLVPPLAFGIAVGEAVHRRLSEAHFRRVIFGLLLVAATILLVRR
jgi:putative spermidine/putrescine transport system permease protein